MPTDLNLTDFTWINPPETFSLEGGVLSMTTLPDTDYWQRTHYGFRRDNGHSFVMPMPAEPFSFSVRTEFVPVTEYDQCGLLLYCDPDNWAKISTEYENPSYSRLGSVVTRSGYSDWATSDVPSATTVVHYRLSRAGPDFLAEQSADGVDWKQMRIFHMDGDLTAARIGVYACSPNEHAGFALSFSRFALTESAWE